MATLTGFTRPPDPIIMADLSAEVTTAMGSSCEAIVIDSSNATSLTTGNVAIIEGFIVPSANGTVIARFASEVLSSAITAKAGAVVYYQQVT